MTRALIVASPRAERALQRVGELFAADLLQMQQLPFTGTINDCRSWDHGDVSPVV
jgi:hypothetical protein